MKMSLGDRVKLALEGPPRRTQVALAKACGIHPVSVNDWVHDRTQQIEGANLLNAASFLDVNPKWLAEGIGPMRSGRQPPEDFVSGRVDGERLVIPNEGASARSIVEQLAAIARLQRPTLRKNLGNLLVELVEHPDDANVVEQTIADIERFFKASQTEG